MSTSKAERRLQGQVRGLRGDLARANDLIRDLRHRLEAPLPQVRSGLWGAIGEYVEAMTAYTISNQPEQQVRAAMARRVVEEEIVTLRREAERQAMRRDPFGLSGMAGILGLGRPRLDLERSLLGFLPSRERSMVLVCPDEAHAKTVFGQAQEILGPTGPLRFVTNPHVPQGTVVAMDEGMHPLAAMLGGKAYGRKDPLPGRGDSLEEIDQHCSRLLEQRAVVLEVVAVAWPGRKLEVRTCVNPAKEHVIVHLPGDPVPERVLLDLDSAEGTIAVHGQDLLQQILAGLEGMGKGWAVKLAEEVVA